MLSVEERILLLDEVASTARSSWQIHLIGHERFSDFPEEHRQNPAYLGYCNMRNLLSVSLMTACYSLIDTNRKTYSFHHAISDKDLQISASVKKHCDICFSLRETIAKYRWSAPIGWSSLNVNAWSASGLSASCFLARAGGSAARYAV